MTIDFTPYGDDWVKEMMKFTKLQLVEKLKEAYIKAEKLTTTGNPKLLSELEDCQYIVAHRQCGRFDEVTERLRVVISQLRAAA